MFAEAAELEQQLNDAGVVATWMPAMLELTFASGRTFVVRAASKRTILVEERTERT